MAFYSSGAVRRVPVNNMNQMKVYRLNDPDTEKITMGDTFTDPLSERHLLVSNRGRVFYTDFRHEERVILAKVLET